MNAAPPAKTPQDTHDFWDSYERALTWEDRLTPLYERLWPTARSIETVPPCTEEQRRGADRIVRLASGRRLWVDEKIRETSYEDILLEIDAVWRGTGHAGNKPGWAVDSSKRTDYVLYVLTKSDKVYLLPSDMLRRALAQNVGAWMRGRDAAIWPVVARNKGYVTRSLAIEPMPLFAAIGRQMLIRGALGETENA